MKFVASFAIYKDGNSAEKKSDEIIGVLNFESSTLGSEKVVLDEKRNAELSEDIVGFSNICSKLL